MAGYPDGKAAVGLADSAHEDVERRSCAVIGTAEVGLLPSPRVQARSHQPQTHVSCPTLPESAIKMNLSVGSRVIARRERLMDGDIMPLRRRPSPGDADGLNAKDVECPPLPTRLPILPAWRIDTLKTAKSFCSISDAATSERYSQ